MSIRAHCHRAAARTALAALLLLTACGPLAPSGGDPTPDDDVVIRVAHDVRSATTMTIYLFTPLGSQIRLGPLRPGGVEEFRLDEDVTTGQYTLAGQLPDGTTFRSRSFILTGRRGVEWSPGAGTVNAISRD